MRIDRVRDGYL